LAYFEGPPDGSGPDHDAQAEAIAMQGRKFVEERWRWEDMQSFMLLMMLEVSGVATGGWRLGDRALMP
jgi:hypothetical protein